MVEYGLVPRLKLVSKNDYTFLKEKFSFFNEAKETQLAPVIASAQPSDVLALTVIPGSGLKILDVKILNEGTEEVFLKLLRDGAGEINA